MVFKKSFPKAIENSHYTKWVEVELTSQEEQAEEKKCREENIALMHQCIDDAKEILLKQSMKVFDPNILQVATALFEKRSSHQVFYKEEKAQEKFDATKK